MLTSYRIRIDATFRDGEHEWHTHATKVNCDEDEGVLLGYGLSRAVGDVLEDHDLTVDILARAVAEQVENGPPDPGTDQLKAACEAWLSRDRKTEPAEEE